jgi:hypothetical protein
MKFESEILPVGNPNAGKKATCSRIKIFKALKADGSRTVTTSARSRNYGLLGPERRW